MWSCRYDTSYLRKHHLFPKWQLEVKDVRTLSASMSLRDPDELHLGPPLTPVSPRTLLRSSQGPPYPAWAALEECWSPVQLQLCPTCPCSPWIWTSTHGLTSLQPWPCLITVILHGGLNSWLNLDIISGDVLLRYPLVFGALALLSLGSMWILAYLPTGSSPTCSAPQQGVIPWVSCSWILL